MTSQPLFRPRRRRRRGRDDELNISTSRRLGLLWSFTRRYLNIIGLGLVLALAVSAMTLAAPMVTRWILETLEIGGSMRDPILTLMGLAVLGATLGWYQRVMLGRLAENIVYDARSRMMLRYLGARVFELLQRSPGELVTRVTSDTVLLNQAASTSIIGLINATVVIIGSVILMGSIDLVLLAGTLAVMVVIFAIVFALLLPRISRSEEKSQEALGELGADLEGTLRAIKTVKASSAERRRYPALLAHIRENRSWSVRSVKIQATMWTIVRVGMDVVLVIVFGLGSMRVASGDLGIPDLVAFLLYVWALGGPVGELTGHLARLQAGMAAAGRIAQIEEMDVESSEYDVEITSGTEANVESRLSVQDSEASQGATAARDATTSAVEFQQVTARYGVGPAAVQQVSLSIPATGHTALVGSSGAGKTTLMNLMLRFLEPESGQLQLGGVPYTELSHAQIRSAFAYVEQETPVVPGTIRENLLFTNPQASEAQVRAVVEQLHLAEKIDSLPQGLDTELTETNVSGGQRQRISVARALLAQPKVLLLDEATAQVDGLTEAAIQQAVAEVAENSAVVSIAHRLSTVMDADEIVVMDQGRTLESGTHRELLATSKLYATLVEALRIETP